jgi:AraC-like DNA-binding protein
MTYYNKQVLFLSDKLYSNVYLLKQVMQAKYFIDNNFSDNITVDDICREACISKYHLLRSFKKIYGTTPGQYLTSLRISKAKMLLEADLLVKDVCYSVGFDSTTSFAGLFKKVVGKSPTNFRKLKMKKSNFEEA